MPIRMPYHLTSMPSKVNEIGFEIIDACISDSRDISNLGSKIYTYNINKLQRRIEEAIRFVSDANVSYCNFTGNKAFFGSAIYLIAFSTRTISNSIFLNNSDALSFGLGDHIKTVDCCFGNNATKIDGMGKIC